MVGAFEGSWMRVMIKNGSQKTHLAHTGSSQFPVSRYAVCTRKYKGVLIEKLTQAAEGLRATNGRNHVKYQK